jgi:hypothetical protein
MHGGRRIPQSSSAGPRWGATGRAGTYCPAGRVDRAPAEGSGGCRPRRFRLQLRAPRPLAGGRRARPQGGRGDGPRQPSTGGLRWVLGRHPPVTLRIDPSGPSQGARWPATVKLPHLAFAAVRPPGHFFAVGPGRRPRECGPSKRSNMRHRGPGGRAPRARAAERPRMGGAHRPRTAAGSRSPGRSFKLGVAPGRGEGME